MSNETCTGQSRYGPAQGTHLTASVAAHLDLSCAHWAAGPWSWLLMWSFQTATSIKRSNFKQFLTSPFVLNHSCSLRRFTESVMGWAAVCMKRVMYGGNKTENTPLRPTTPCSPSQPLPLHKTDIHHRQMPSQLVQKPFWVSEPHELAHADTACSVI